MLLFFGVLASDAILLYLSYFSTCEARQTKPSQPTCLMPSLGRDGRYKPKQTKKEKVGKIISNSKSHYIYGQMIQHIISLLSLFLDGRGATIFLLH